MSPLHQAATLLHGVYALAQLCGNYPNASLGCSDATGTNCATPRLVDPMVSDYPPATLARILKCSGILTVRGTYFLLKSFTK